MGGRASMVVCTLALAGCYDFSRFDHLDGAVSHDASSADLAQANTNVLVDEPFDDLDSQRWMAGSTPQAAAFSIDETMHIEGTGSLHVDVAVLDTLDDSILGNLSWIGSTLPSDYGSRHLRFYARYDDDIDANVNFAVVAATGDSGITVTIQPHDGNNLSHGADVVLNQYTDHYLPTSTIVHPNAWHCYELAVTASGDSSWTSTLSVDGTLTNVTDAFPLAGEVTQLGVGFGLAQTPQNGAKNGWIDAVIFSTGDATIGCPY